MCHLMGPMPKLERKTMKCPGCKSENQSQNFCGNCGTQLKEKCTECGAMETIGRKNCEKNLKEAISALECFSFNRSAFRLFSCMATLILGGICMELNRRLCVEGFKTPKWLIMLVWWPMLFSLLLMWYQACVIFDKPSKKLRKIFARKNPHYAEILAKAEEEEK